MKCSSSSRPVPRRRSDRLRASSGLCDRTFWSVARGSAWTRGVVHRPLRLTGPVALFGRMTVAAKGACQPWGRRSAPASDIARRRRERSALKPRAAGSNSLHPASNRSKCSGDIFRLLPPYLALEPARTPEMSWGSVPYARGDRRKGPRSLSRPHAPVACRSLAAPVGRRFGVIPSREKEPSRWRTVCSMGWNPVSNGTLETPNKGKHRRTA